MSGTVTRSKAHAQEVIGPKGESTAVVLLNGQVVKLSSEYLCLFTEMSAAFNLGKQDSLCSDQQLMQRPITEQRLRLSVTSDC